LPGLSISKKKVIDRAMIACDNSGHEVVCDFVEVSNIVTAGASTKPLNDFELSRYACCPVPWVVPV
jgi:DNA-damage-inducible protein D